MQTVNGLVIISFLLILSFGCTTAEKQDDKLFTLLSPEATGIDFNNQLKEFRNWSYLRYYYYYNGGGIAIGDVNNDGFPDIYFTGNMDSNKLYLNKGNRKDTLGGNRRSGFAPLQFEDITEKAGVGGNGMWMTGVTMADVNNDGLLDIYVCKSSTLSQRNNLLYINQGTNEEGIPTFTEEAAAYGIDDDGYSSQATFLDYDRDGDLDLYVLNHPVKFSNTYRLVIGKELPAQVSDKLFRNEGNGTFTEITEEAGIQQYGYGLSASVGDFNNDGWPDIYVANDFSTPDFLYINQRDGTFKDEIRQATKHTSFFGMGTDAADFNNDGFLDIIELDMMPEDDERRKNNTEEIGTKVFWQRIASGMHYQYIQNTLQLNNGNNPHGHLTFSEVGELAGIEKTDWSWAPLLADFNNDGYKDLFITNGMRRDVNDNDYWNERNNLNNELVVAQEELKKIPVHKIDNYAYVNKGDLTFALKTKEWGLSYKGFSNGAAYADLDLDGDLDLVLNNLEDVAMVFENRSRQLDSTPYLQFAFRGTDDNTFGLGCKVLLRYENQMQYQELTLTRGFQSSVPPVLHFGLGTHSQVDEVEITWPNGKKEILKNVAANQFITIHQENARDIPDTTAAPKTLFVTPEEHAGIDFLHQENVYDDFAYERLLPHKLSNLGPRVAVGDVNNDGREDFFIGAAREFSGVLFLQKEDGTFIPSSSQPWTKDKNREDIGCLLFDADNDSDLDLYVVSGGNESPPGAPDLQDRLYVNDGSGQFKKDEKALPTMFTSGSCVEAADFDRDGDLDLFVGGRVVPGQYPLPPRSYLLQNQGGTKDAPRFEDVTARIAPQLVQPGLVTAAIWTDFDGDHDKDLIVCGEWMPLSFYKNEEGIFQNMTTAYGFENTTGWWACIAQSDFDGDGDMDYIVGNLGSNYRYRASPTEPFHIYAHDFDENGSVDIVLSYIYQGREVPVRSKLALAGQNNFINKKFTDFHSFAKASLSDIYGQKALDHALHLSARDFASCYIENMSTQNDVRFKRSPLPNLAQISVINAVIPADFDQDGNPDVVMAGNNYASEVNTARNDASIGLLLRGDGKGNFIPVPYMESGFYAPHDVKDLAMIQTLHGSAILVANNQEKLQLIRYKGQVQNIFPLP